VYAETHKQIGSHLEHRHTTLVAAIAGGVAGGAQAILAAPAENVRIILEGGSGQGDWKNVWREVFQGTEPNLNGMKTKEARETRAWMQEVRGMVGRGWEGWRLGVAKDIVGGWWPLLRTSHCSLTGSFHAQGSQPSSPCSTYRVGQPTRSAGRSVPIRLMSRKQTEPPDWLPIVGSCTELCWSPVGLSQDSCTNLLAGPSK
jgi:hypothetical protein